ncbi:serine/threonine-protein kinase PknG [Nocardia sp. NBC_01503]|uniref:serine/threonine-protein kinase n=1 Tax=Nocardia sp. NBC_01503 TaxID=2975997 RepID=UPI002E7AD7A5|nr:tetratricopeptide repeat protein [Nocardia sp. NBC_01503]WTL29570.1 serine/threonine-protein kinase PknG [Nocardia sp. NBC_01503]
MKNVTQDNTEASDAIEGQPHSDRSGPVRQSPLRWGLRLVSMPAVPPVEPEAAVLTKLEVPEAKRFCWKCRRPVGRHDDHGPGAIQGACGHCRESFSFRPALRDGDVVADQYEIRGCLAYGGIGWVFLARDRHVGGRWVVLKGLQNPRDIEAHVAALAERQFLSEVIHPAIVKIFNFVTHRTADGVSAGYIVMEYIGGRSLGAMLEQQAREPLPVAQAITYLLEILPALDYLHSLGLAYNDLKPDNIMVSQDEVKLIDLGAVAALRSGGSLYGTPGYQAPEVPRTGPTVASDIYTVGRTLAALTLPGGSRWRTTEDEPILRRHPAFAKLLRRATDADPAKRFPSASVMYRQLGGVLRMVLARDTGTDHRQISTTFGAPRTDFGVDALLGGRDAVAGHPPRLDAAELAAALPIPMIDPEEPSFEFLSAQLQADPGHALEGLRISRTAVRKGLIELPDSFELESALIETRAYLDIGSVRVAREILDRLRDEHANDWRIDWYDGLADVVSGELEKAYARFELVAAMVPGELAPPLALAATAELLAQADPDPRRRARWSRSATDDYRSVWRTDRTMVTAAFGLARQQLGAGDTAAAIDTLRQVQPAARNYDAARMTLSLLLVSRTPAQLTQAQLDEAAERLRGLPRERRALELRSAVLESALRWFCAGGRPGTPDDTILGHLYTERGLRKGLESALRAVAHATPDRFDRFALVDRANAVRPRSWI